MSRVFSGIAIIVVLFGCASPRGFDRGELRTAVSPEAIVTEEEIQRVLELKPQLPRPFKLGIYLTSPKSRHWSSSWNWLPRDKEAILAIGEALSAQGLVSETVFVSPATAPDEKLKSIRLAAARPGLDALLVVSGISDIDRYNNVLGPTYALIVTPLFVPGTVADGLFLSHAGLWDVRNGYLYVSVEADGESTTTAPAAFLDESDVVSDSKEKSLAALLSSVKSRIQNLAR